MIASIPLSAASAADILVCGDSGMIAQVILDARAAHSSSGGVFL